MTNEEGAQPTGVQQPAVTMERVIEAMRTFDIELEKVPGNDTAATANLNGLPVLFALLDTVVIVRCDVPTDASFAQADAGLFLAANQINSVPFGARAVIADHDDMLVVRTERDVPCAAGLSDAQLAPALQDAVDGVLGAQDAMVAAAEEMTKLGEQAAEGDAESANAKSAD